MTTQTVNNPPRAADWTRAAANLNAHEQIVNGPAADVTLPGGDVYPSLQRQRQNNPRGAWASTTAYAIKDVVTNSGIAYIALVAHTSAGSFSTDLSASRWAVLQGVTTEALAAATAAAGIGVAGGRDLQSRINDIRSVLDHGGTPNNSLDNYGPTLALRTALSNAGTMRFPFVAGSANVYKFTTATYSIFDGHTLDVDEGVTLSFPDDGFLYTSAVFKVARPFLAYFQSLNAYSWVSDNRNRPLVSKQVYLSPADVDTSTLTPVACDNAAVIRHQAVAWPSGDTFSTVSPLAASASGVQWQNTVSGTTAASFVRLRPGDELSAYFDITSGSPTLVAMARGAGGYGGLYTSALNDGSGTDIFRKDVGVSATQTTAGYYGKGTHANYSGRRALWTIRLISWNAFEVLFNGMRVTQGVVAGPIDEVGFGFYSTADYNATVQDWVIRRNSVNYGTSLPLSICTFGDSITSSRYECWPNYMRETLEGTLGLRVFSLTNRAVAGDDLAGQYAVMNDDGINGANIVVMQVGTNDVQGLTSKSSFLTNLQNVLTYCNTAGATLVFGIPPEFYTQAQAGSRGQAASNYERGNYIRGAILRFCADNGLRCVDSGQVLGPLLANYVNSALTPYWGGDPANDPMLYDNIHPTPVMERLLGIAYAKAVAGAVMSAGNNITPFSLRLAPTTLRASVMRNSWAMTTEPVNWQCDEAGAVTFSGVFDKSTGVLTDSTQIAQLPRALWPEAPVRAICATSALTKPCVLFVSTAGAVTIYGADAAVTFVYADGLRWNIKGS